MTTTNGEGKVRKKNQFPGSPNFKCENFNGDCWFFRCKADFGRVLLTRFAYKLGEALKAKITRPKLAQNILRTNACSFL